MQPPKQVIAIDWSGAEAKAAQRRGIRAAVCDVETGEVELRPGLLRSEVEAWLTELAPDNAEAESGREAQVVAGLDFSFSYPAWFLHDLGCRSASALWARAAEEGEQWLRAPHPHFWGRRKGSGPPATHRAPEWLGYRACERFGYRASERLGYRASEREVFATKPQVFATKPQVLASKREVFTTKRLPLSSFQIGGAGAVGTGTLRGMPMLARLRAAGWSVWPFDPPRLPMLLEIYPRALTGPVVKSDAAERTRYLARPQFAGLQPEAHAEAIASEDAFDALVSALAMREHAASFAQLQQTQDEQTRLEGAIWRPPIQK